MTAKLRGKAELARRKYQAANKRLEDALAEGKRGDELAELHDAAEAAWKELLAALPKRPRGGKRG